MATKRSRDANPTPELKRSRSDLGKEGGPGSKKLADILAFGVAFHDEARQAVARKQGWLLGTSALGDDYTKYEAKVWSDIRVRKKFDMSPDELSNILLEDPHYFNNLSCGLSLL